MTLQELTIGADELETFSTSISLLQALQRLTVNCSKLERLPDNFGSLSSLEELVIRSRSLESLPESAGQLHSLERLTLAAGKSVRSVLDDIGQISSLRYIEFDCDGHEETPNLFAHISCFVHELSLTGLDTRILPTGLGSLSSLENLTFSSLLHLETLPDELGTLSSLEWLTIRGCGMLESLPDSLGQVSSLKMVNLECCKRLKTLPESFGKCSSTQQALPQADQSDALRLQAEEYSQTNKTEAMLLIVVECPLLDDSVLESLGWIFMPSKLGYVRRDYERKSLSKGSAPC